MFNKFCCNQFEKVSNTILIKLGLKVIKVSHVKFLYKKKINTHTFLLANNNYNVLNSKEKFDNDSMDHIATDRKVDKVQNI